MGAGNVEHRHVRAVKTLRNVKFWGNGVNGSSPLQSVAAQACKAAMAELLKEESEQEETETPELWRLASARHAAQAYEAAMAELEADQALLQAPTEGDREQCETDVAAPSRSNLAYMRRRRSRRPWRSWRRIRRCCRR